MERTIVNQCGTEMHLFEYEEHEYYFTGVFLGQPVLGIEFIEGEPHTITLNLSHEGARRALKRLVDGDLSQHVGDCESRAKDNS